MIKKGDRVVCVKAGPDRLCPPVILGREYIVYGIHTCGCNRPLIDVGLVNKHPLAVICTGCGQDTPTKDPHWASSNRFRKVQEKTKVVYISEKIKKEIEETILN